MTKPIHLLEGRSAVQVFQPTEFQRCGVWQNKAACAAYQTAMGPFSGLLDQHNYKAMAILNGLIPATLAILFARLH